MTKAGLQWYEDEEAMLAHLWRHGHPKSDIAQRLSRTVKSIEKRASQLRLPHRAPRGVCKPGPTKFDSAAAMESNMREQDKQFIEAMLNAGYVMTRGRSTLNSSGSSR